MISLTVSEIAEIVGGAVVGPTDGATVTGQVVVDSRLAEPGSLFVAVSGEHVDGHDFADAAVARGATAVLSVRPTAHPGVVVDDPLRALAALATEVLRRLRTSGELTVLAVTGSQGKTTTKDLLAAVLSEFGTTVATQASYNNEIGLPLTVLRATSQTQYLVLEMGARGPGHIRTLTQIAPPDIALVVNVGAAHLGEFGTIEDTAQAKGEIVEGLAAGGLAVLNADDPRVLEMAGRAPDGVRTFGTGESDVRLAEVALDDLARPAFVLSTSQDSVRVRLRLVGEHQASNAAAVAAAATGLGLPLAEVGAALAGVQRISPWRMEVHELANGVTLIDDTYNANPDSMAAALRALAAIGQARGAGCRTVAVVGEMRELGASAHHEHDGVGRLAVRLGIHQLVVIGEAARAAHEGALLEGSWREEPVFVADNDEAIAWQREALRAGDVVLVKASRGARLDEVAAGIRETGSASTTEAGR